MGLLDQPTYREESDGFTLPKEDRAFLSRQGLLITSGKMAEISDSAKDVQLDRGEAFVPFCVRQSDSTPFKSVSVYNYFVCAGRWNGRDPVSFGGSTRPNPTDYACWEALSVIE